MKDLISLAKQTGNKRLTKKHLIIKEKWFA